MHYSAAPWRDLQQFPFLSRIMADAPHLRLNFDELHMLAEEVFPRVRQG
ncbi:MAG: hypothetical protein ACREK6_10330 [Candidatus Rokuibacteriota bacterium]